MTGETISFLEITSKVSRLGGPRKQACSAIFFHSGSFTPLAARMSGGCQQVVIHVARRVRESARGLCTDPCSSCLAGRGHAPCRRCR